MTIKLYNSTMMPDSFSRTFLVLLLLLVMPLTHAHAQVEQSVPVPATPPAVPSQAQSMPPDPDNEITILRDNYAGKYSPSSLENLAKLYWRLGAFDLEDGEAVGNYLKIVECKLFTEYINDDLEWKEIIRTMKKHIAEHRDGFPISFQFVLQLHLGRYDPVLGGFPIVDKTGFKNAKRIEVDSIDRRRDICFDPNPIKDYPKSLILLLQNPFTLDFLKLDEHVSQAYILRKKSEFSELPDSVRVSRYERDAYLRLRITFYQYHGNMRGEGNAPTAILQGKIDGYEIFEDAAQKRLMLSIDADAAKTSAAPEMSVPVQPLSELAEKAAPRERQEPIPDAVQAAPKASVGFAATP